MDQKVFYYGVQGVRGFEALRLALGYALFLLCRIIRRRWMMEGVPLGTQAAMQDGEGIMIIWAFFMRNENRFISRGYNVKNGTSCKNRR
jgi:hypothetical protein